MPRVLGFCLVVGLLDLLLWCFTLALLVSVCLGVVSFVAISFMVCELIWFRVMVT